MLWRATGEPSSCAWDSGENYSEGVGWSSVPLAKGFWPGFQTRGRTILSMTIFLGLLLVR